MKLHAEVVGGGISGPQFGPAPGARWITTAQQWQAQLDQSPRWSYRGKGLTASQVNFEQAGLLLIWMGDKPTGGFAIDLLPEQSSIRQKTAILTVEWIEPAPGAMVTQMLTQPYLLVRIDKNDFNRIEVVDQRGQKHIDLDLAGKRKS